MKKKIKFMISMLIIVLSMLFIHSFGMMVLKRNNLAFRPWVITVMFVVGVIAGILFLISTILILMKVIDFPCKTRFKNLAKKFLCALGVIMCIGGIVMSGLLGFFTFAFSYEPEHIVERDGKKMIGCVDSFMQVYVNYHEYKNVFIMGNKSLIIEDYGNGGYDPLEEGKDIQPNKTTYYYKR